MSKFKPPCSSYLQFWECNFCGFGHFLILSFNSSCYFLEFFFVDAPCVEGCGNIPCHGSKHPVSACELDSCIQAKTPGRCKFSDNPVNYFGIDAVVQTVQGQAAGIGKSNPVISG